MEKNRKILLVDDEKNILSAYKRNLRTKFNVYLADDPFVALEIIKNYGPFAAIVSDLKMPRMNGLELLEKVKSINKNTVRIMLTGFADVETAIEAINNGNIFRLLTKPCKTEDLAKALDDAIEQYNLIMAEKELLTETLRGAINILVEILSTVQPLVFNFTMRFKTLAKAIAERLKYPNIWEVEISVLLMHIGLVSVPTEIIEKKLHGLKLTDEELKIFIEHPTIGASLISNIPRLSKISENIKNQFLDYKSAKAKFKNKSEEEIFPILILKTLNDYFELLATGITPQQAIKKMEKEIEVKYSKDVLGALDAEISGIEKDRTIRIIKINELKPGVVLAEDLRDVNNFLLLPKGSRITPITFSKIINYNKMTKIKEPIEIIDEITDDKIYFRK